MFDEKKFREFFPSEMLNEKRWVRYFLKAKPDGGTAKIPLANHSDPSTWSHFDECVKAIENDQQSLGYCWLGGDIQALDLDHVRNPKTGDITKEAMLLLSRLGSLAEYSVSGQGIHVFFKGSVRGKDLTTTHLQFWNSKNSPRFFALTAEPVGAAFRELKDIGSDFDLVFATAKHTSAKIREQLKELDFEQWAALPKERGTTEVVSHEKPKVKTRKVVQGFDIKDFLSYYGIPIVNECDNEIGHCLRVGMCPIKRDAHVGQNGTTTNFVFPCTDGGLAFHCQSSGCCDYSIAEAIKHLEQEHGIYPSGIYETQKHTHETKWEYIVALEDVSADDIEEMQWLWNNYLPKNQLVHSAGASSQGKSPVWRDLIARMTSGQEWPNGEVSQGPCTVVVMSNEDDWPTVVIPHLKQAGANFKYIKRVKTCVNRGDSITDISAALDRDIEALDRVIRERGDVGALVIDPITNYLGRAKMNHEDEMRAILMPMAQLAQSNKVSVNTIGHFNKSQDVQMLDKVMGARAFVGVARQALFFTPDEEEESEFAHVVGFGRKTTTPGLKYCTKQETLVHNSREIKVVAVEWGGESHQDMEKAVTEPMKKSEKVTAKEVCTIVKTALMSGQKPTEYLESLLKDSGVDLKPGWTKPLKKFADSGKGGVEGKGDKFFWWLRTQQTEFDR